MPHKESKLGSFGGRAEVASVDFINAILEQDRNTKKKNEVTLYTDICQRLPMPTASELLRQIDHDSLDPTQQLLAHALELQSQIRITKAEEEIATAVTTREAVRKYKNTPKYQKRLSTIQSKRSEGQSNEESRSRFAGAIFADIAHHLYLPSVREGILLAGEVSDSVFLEFLNGEIPIDHEYGVKTLDGFSIPDGMVISVVDTKPQITKFVEYSLTQKAEKYTIQFDGYKNRVADFSLKSPTSVSSNFQVGFVVPRPTFGIEYPKLDSTEGVSGSYHFLPIDVQGFGQEIDDIIADKFKLTFSQRSRSRY